MVDPGLATVIAAGAALVVGVTGIITSLYLAGRGRRDALRLQWASDQARALVRVLQVVETRSQDVRDKIFNLTKARSDPDEFTGAPDNEYGPHRRDLTNLPRSAVAETEALVAAYGNNAVRASYREWDESLESCEDAMLRAEWNYFEGQKDAVADDFMVEVEREQAARTRLEHTIQATLTTGGRRRPTARAELTPSR
jgi:hypothetical protein